MNANHDVQGHLTQRANIQDTSVVGSEKPDLLFLFGGGDQKLKDTLESNDINLQKDKIIFLMWATLGSRMYYNLSHL